MKPLHEPNAATGSWLDLVQDQVHSMSYGIVQIVVHDHRVVQIERTEKFRFSEPSGQTGSGTAGRPGRLEAHSKREQTDN
jgi:hypothetical protein